MRTSVLGSATRIEPVEIDRETVDEVNRAVAGAQPVALRLADGQEIALPEVLVDVLRATAGELSAGHAVTVLASEVLLSPAEVGGLLGLSRPFVARLLDDGTIASENLPGSRHRVVSIAEVLEFQRRRERKRVGRRRVADAVEAARLPY